MEKEMDLVRRVGSLLRSQKTFLVTAESCTGGLLGHLITESPGASDLYLGGFVTYDNQAKERFLGVSADTLRKFGAVSEQTAREMAAGARQAFAGIQDLDRILSTSITGIAGPDGGSPEKPVGTVWIAVAWEGGVTAKKFLFTGDRSEIKKQAAGEALRMILNR